MSARMNQDLPRGMPEVREFKFTAPTALNTNTTGTDSRTGETEFDLLTINAILRAIIDVAVATVNVSYEFDITRDGYVVYTLYGSLLKYDLQYVPEVFPLNLRPGKYQIRMRQTLGNLAGRTLTATFQTRLAPVG